MVFFAGDNGGVRRAGEYNAKICSGRADSADDTCGSCARGQFPVATGAIYKLGYDLVADLEPVALLPSNPMIVVSKNAVPAKTLGELLAWLKARPTPASAGTAGAGSGSHIAGLYFENISGAKLQ